MASFFFVSSTRSVHFLCIMHFYHMYLVLHFQRNASKACNKAIPKQKSPPFHFFDTMRLSPFFWHCETVQISHFFPNLFYCSKGSPINFLIFCNRMDVQKNPKGSPLLHFLALYDLPETSEKFERKSEKVFSFFESFRCLQV